MPLQSRFMGRAYDALDSERGRTACAQGWGIAFFEFIAQHGRKPNEGEEQRACRDGAAAIAAAKADWPPVFRDAHTRRAARFERIAHGLEV
jgi:hypothetical protein